MAGVSRAWKRRRPALPLLFLIIALLGIVAEALFFRIS